MLILASDGSRSKRMVNCSVILNYCQINLTKRVRGSLSPASLSLNISRLLVDVSWLEDSYMRCILEVALLLVKTLSFQKRPNPFDSRMSDSRYVKNKLIPAVAEMMSAWLVNDGCDFVKLVKWCLIPCVLPRGSDVFVDVRFLTCQDNCRAIGEQLHWCPKCLCHFAPTGENVKACIRTLRNV